jgi:fructokinase
MTPAAHTAASKPIAVGLGEVLWDILPAGKQLGGAPANFAFHAQQLGARGVVFSAVGRDALGEEIEARLAELGLASNLHRCERPTGTVSVQLDAAGVPSYVIHQPVAWDEMRDAGGATDLAAQANVVCFGSLAQRALPSRTMIHAFLAATRRDECLRVFDINLRQDFYSESIICESLDVAGVLKLNDQELPVVASLLHLPAEEQKFAGTLLARLPTLRLIALTRGPNGSALFTREETSEHPGVPTTLADTVGAGDAFTATLALGLLRGMPLDRINAAANRVAAYVCSQPGATPALPPALAREVCA